MVVAGWVAIIVFWSAAPFTLTADDSYYYFQIARYVARGDGLTFDGIQETTGFHPLWLFALVPLGSLLDRTPEVAVRLVLLGQVALVVAGTLRLSRTKSGGEWRAVIVFAAFALSFEYAKIFVNGLESAFEFTLLALALSAAERARDHRKVAAVAFLCGLVTLSRLSALPGALALVAVVLHRHRTSLGTAIIVLGSVLVPVTGYAIFLYLRTGHAIPISAAVKYRGPFGFHESKATALAVAAAFVVGLLARAEWRRQADLPIWALPLGSWITFQLACDAFLRARIIPEVWTLVPHATLAVLATSEAWRRYRWDVRWLWTAAAVVASVVWTVRLRPETYSFYIEARNVGRWLEMNTPRDSRIAGWDCGIEAFYSRRAFLNLDGLASSWDYKTDYLDRRRVREFLDARGVDYVAQYVPERTTLAHFHGVDLSGWKVVYDEPYEFRGLLDWTEGPRRHRFVVLQRP